MSCGWKQSACLAGKVECFSAVRQSPYALKKALISDRQQSADSVEKVGFPDWLHADR
jgi:hypothetical protein